MSEIPVYSAAFLLNIVEFLVSVWPNVSLKAAVSLLIFSPLRDDLLIDVSRVLKSIITVLLLAFSFIFANICVLALLG